MSLETSTLSRLGGKISVLIPCFDEARSIRKNLAEISAFLDGFAERYELICVDDGSRDGTLDELRATAEQDPHIRVLYYDENHGKGFALRHGFQAADGDYIVFLDGDLDLHPRLLTRFFDILQRENADVVIGSKRHPESRVFYPLRRKIISKVYHFILRLLFGLPLKDTQVGLKVFKRQVLDDVFHKIICKRFALDVELLANIHRMDYRIVEAPVTLEFQRNARWGRVTWATLWNTLLDTLAIYYRMRVLKYYDLTFLKSASYPRLAVIVPYDEYSSEVEQTLRGCLEIQYDKLQIIATGATPPRIVSDRIQHLRTDSESRSLLEIIKGLPAELLAFIRPGTVPDRLWLEKACKNMGSHQIVAVSGPVLPLGAPDFWSEAVQKVLSSLTGCGGFRYRYVQSLHRYINTVTMSNLVIRKEDLVAALKQNRLEAGIETWLGQYISQESKRRIVYDPEAIVYRRVAPLFVPYLLTIFEWGLDRGRYTRQNPGSLLRWPDGVFILPSLLILFLAGAPLFFLNPVLAKFCLLVLAAYLILVALESVASLRPRMVLVIFVGIITTHIAYGAGCLVALFSHPRSEVKSVALGFKP